MEQFKSIKKEAAVELVEKKSRFICSTSPVSNEDEAMEFIRKISSRYRDASHNVYAYVISGPVEIQKASDDGEPQGTGGIPVLEVIKREDLTNVCVIVTRYFGGILLGSGGLIRAYSTAARNGISESGKCLMSLFTTFSAEISYSQLGKVQNAVTNMGNTISRVEYLENVKMIIKSRFDILDSTIKCINEITNGEAKVERLEDAFDISKVI